MLGERFGPLYDEEGRGADQTDAARPVHRRGGGQTIAARVKSDLPGPADTKVTSHLLGQHGHPSSKALKRGVKASPRCCTYFRQLFLEAGVAASIKKMRGLPRVAGFLKVDSWAHSWRKSRPAYLPNARAQFLDERLDA
jgi:hypothetical protein